MGRAAPIADVERSPGSPAKHAAVQRRVPNHPPGHGSARFAWKPYLVAGLVAVASCTFTHGQVRTSLYGLIGGSAVVAVLLGARRHRATVARPWHFLALGLTYLLVGDLIGNAHRFVRQVEAPSPSWADAVALAGYSLLFVGLLLLLRAQPRPLREGNGGVIDTAIVVVAAAAVTWTLVIDAYEAELLHSGAAAVTVAYPTLDLALVAVLARLVMSPGHRVASLRLLAVGMWVLIAGDIAGAALTAHGGQAGADLLRLGWLAGSVGVGAAVLHPCPPAPPAPEESARAGINRGRLAVLALVSVAPLTASVVANGLNVNQDISEVAVSSGVLFVLVLIRMGLLVRQLERAATTEDELGVIVETSRDAIIGTRLDGTITSWNAGARGIYGYTAEEMLGRSIADLASPASEGGFDLILEKLGSGERIEDHLSRHATKDGSDIHVSVSISPIPDAGGSITRAAVIAKDITERVRADEKVRLLQATRARLLGRTISAAEQERKMLAAELHDGPVQHLTAIDVTIETLRLRLESAAPGSTKPFIRIQRGLQKSILELRRLMTELHPPALRERGLDAALADYLGSTQRSFGVECHLDSELHHRLHPDIETTVYRVTQEAVANVVRHAGARNIWVSIWSRERQVFLEVRDDGAGFEIDSKGPTYPVGEHYGLIGMRERAEMAGGEWEIHSAPGVGTRVCVSLPLEVVS